MATDRAILFTIGADGKAALAEIDKVTGAVKASAGQLNGAFESIHSKISLATGALATLAAGAGFKKIISETIDWNMSANQLAKSLGTTTEQSSVLRVAMHAFGIENDTVVAASNKLAMTLSKGTDVFDKYGIKVTNAKGELLSTPEIMANVNQKLLETASGTDRNVIAMSIYGRNWKDVQAVLKLTPEAMEEARATAERLHLVVGPEGIEQSIQYKKNLREISLVSEAMAIQMGNRLLPAVVSVGSALAESGVGGASIFAEAMKESIRVIQQAGPVLGATYDKIKAWNDTGGFLGHLFSKEKNDEYKRRLQQIDEAAVATIVDINKKLDEAGKKSSVKPGDKLAPGTLGNDTADKEAQRRRQISDILAAIGERDLMIGKDQDEKALLQLDARHRQEIDKLTTLHATTAQLEEAAAAQKKERDDLASQQQKEKSNKDAADRYELVAYYMAMENQLKSEEAQMEYQLEVKNQQRIRDERQQSFNHQIAMADLQNQALTARLSFIGEDQAALDASYAWKRQRIDEQLAFELQRDDLTYEQKLQKQQEYQAASLQLQQEQAQRQADLWWNGAQTYMNYAQQMTTFGIQMLMADEKSRGQIGKRMLATTVRFLAQSLQAYMFNKAKEHILAAASAAGQITTQVAQHTTSLSLLETEAIAWAAFFTAMSMNPYGGQMFIPAATAMTAVAGGVVPAALAATAAEGAAGVATELGMAAAWAAGGVLVGALGEAGASAIEGGISSSGTSVGSGGSGSLTGIGSGSATTSSAAAVKNQPSVTVHIHGNVVDNDKFARDLMVSIQKAVNDGYSTSGYTTI